MKKLLLVCAVVSLCKASGVVWASEGGGKADEERCGAGRKGMACGPVGTGWFLHNEEAMKSLGATEEQLGQLREMTYQGEIRQIKGRADLEIARKALRRLLDDTKPTEEAVGIAIDKISGLEAQLQKEQIKQRFKAREILGEETYGKIQDRVKDRMREHGMDRERSQRDDCHGMGPWNDENEREHSAAGSREKEDKRNQAD